MREKNLLNALEEDARKEYSAIIEDARKEAETILKDAVEEAERLKASQFEKEKLSIILQRMGKLANARLYVNEVLLKERQIAIKEVLEGVHDRFKEISQGKEYPQILKRLFQEAIKEWRENMGDEKAVVVAKKEDVSILENLTDADNCDIMTDETGNIISGVIIMSRNKRYRIINTMQSRLKKARSASAPNSGRSPLARARRSRVSRPSC